MNEITEKPDKSLPSPTAYDDVFKTLLHDCGRLVIPLVNEMFGKTYDMNEGITLKNSTHFIHQEQTEYKRVETDTEFYIGRDDSRIYHIECQSTRDSSMLIRVFEYDTQTALEGAQMEGNVLRVRFPNTGVLYLRSNENTPDEMMIVISTPGGNIEYSVPTLKMQDYKNIDAISEKQLYFLIPFYLFNEEKMLDKYDKDQLLYADLKFKYVDIFEDLKKCVSQGLLNAYEGKTIFDLSNIVAQKLAAKTQYVKEMINSMGGKILDYPAKDILNRGIEQGIEQGMERGYSEGERNAYINMYMAGKIDLVFFTGQMKCSIEQAMEIIKEYEGRRDAYINMYKAGKIDLDCFAEQMKCTNERAKEMIKEYEEKHDAGSPEKNKLKQ